MDPNPGDVIALGILSGTTIKRDANNNIVPCQTSLNTDCTVIHMPIDYIYDHLSTLTLNKAPQN